MNPSAPHPASLASHRGFAAMKSKRALACTALMAAVILAGGGSSSAQTPVAVPATVVGQSSVATTITVNITTGGTSAAPAVLTQGIPGLDFAAVTGGSCAAGAVYTNTPGQQCTVSVVFSPLYPGKRDGAVVITSTTGALLGSTLITGNATGSLAVLVPGEINTVAGNDFWIFAGDGGAATQTSVFLPTGVLTDAAGNMFLADSSNNRIRRVDATTKDISTIAGDGNPGFSGDNGPATLAEVSIPAGLALDGAGNIYFADTGNHAIRRIDAVSGFITTVAGTGGVAGFAGDNGPATSAKLSLPEGVAFDAAGNMYITDTGNNRIREVNVSTGVITTIAGTGAAGYNADGILATTALLNAPWGLSVATSSTGLVTIYFADLSNSRIRMINPAGFISTIAGTGQLGFAGDGSEASAAVLDEPASAVFDPAGNLYIADSGNNRIREITPANGNLANGVIQTIAGTGQEQLSGDQGPANEANLYGPYGLFFDQAGNLFLTDMFHNRIREISATTISLEYATLRVGKVSPPQIEGLENVGNTSLNIAAPTFNNSTLDPATTTCNTGTIIAPGMMCNLGIDFAPTVVGNPVLGTLLVNSNAGNTPTTVDLSGDVLNVNPTTISISSSLNPSTSGAPVTFSSTISAGGATVTGTVTFLDGSIAVCTGTVNGNNVASCTTTTALALGNHNMTASYAGDPSNAAGVSGVLIQNVEQATSIALIVSPNPATVTQNVTLTATISAASGTPAGTITFFDGTTAIGSAILANGVASFSTTTLSAGTTHNLSAQYPGDKVQNFASTSNTVAEVVQLDPTSTTLGSSGQTVAVGTSITFTGSVSSMAIGSVNGPAPTGTIQFADTTSVANPVALGSGTITNGVATFSLSTLAPGTHPIVATYSGDKNDATSKSTTLVETIQQIGTTTTLTSTPNPANAGASVLLSVNVAMVAGAVADGAVTGKVTFSLGSTVLGSATLDVNGNASISVSTLPVGADNIVAVYAGNTNYSTSTSATLNEQINQTGTTTVLTSSNQSALEGKSVTFSAAVTSSTGIVTGAVNFLYNGKNVGTGTLNTGGVATLTLATLPVGSQQPMVAVYIGDSDYTTSTSVSIPETISLATPTMSLTGPTSPINAGTSVTLTGTISSNGITPTGALTLLDGTTAIAAQNAAAGGSFTFPASTLSVGKHTLTVSYAGDANNSTATSNSFVITVQQAPTTTSLTSSANPQTLAKSVTFTAATTSVSAGLSGTVTFMANGSSIGSATLGANGTAVLVTSSLAFGPQAITAVYSGDTNHATSTSAALSEQIVQAASAVVSSSVNPSVAGANVIFTAKISGVGATIPTGMVTFADGTTTLGSVTLDGAGTASFQTANLAVSSHSISASYAGDKNYSLASASLTQTVQSASTQITLTSSASPATYGAALAFTSTITSNGVAATGTVTYTDGGTTIGSALLNANGVATLSISTLAPGSHTIVANYGGDGKAAASVSSPLVLVVKESTTVALASNSNPALTLAPIVLTAAITNGGVGVATGIVTFTDGSTQLGTAPLNASGIASLTVPSLAAGTHAITASYAGDGGDFSGVSSPLVETVQLRASTTTLTATETNTDNLLQVTLISVERWTGTTVPTGTVTFTNGSTIVGSSPLDATGVATLTIVLQAPSENISSTYAGDTVYAGSSSPAVSVTGGQPTEFTMALNPPNLTMQSKEHGVTTLTLSSVQSFADTLQLGCVGLPASASCTFSTTQSKLVAGGLSTVTLTVDTGNPLGAGAEDASVAQKHSSGIMLAFLPIGLLAGYGLFRTRRRSFVGLLLVVCAIAATLGVTGCAGLQVNGTPAGTYTFKVTAVGMGTGVSQDEIMTLTVTQ